MPQDVENIGRNAKGQLTGPKGLTGMQHRFVRTFLSSGGDLAKAGKSAGCDENDTYMYQLFSNQNVQKAIRKGQERELARLSIRSLRVIESILNDKGEDAATKDRKLRAASKVLSAYKLVSEPPKAADAPGKAIDQLTVGELEHFIRSYGEAQAGVARTIEGEAQTIIAINPPSD